MATIYVDDKPFRMNPEESLLHGWLSQGFKAPCFFW